MAEKSEATHSLKWKYRYAKCYCRDIPNVHSNGLRSISGVSRCLRFTDGRDCEGHDNENWAELEGPDFWKNSYSDGINPWFMHSEQAALIVRRVNQGPAFDAMVEVLVIVAAAATRMPPAKLGEWDWNFISARVEAALKLAQENR